MFLDTDIPIGSIEYDPQKVRLSMASIAKCAHRDWAAHNEWADHLKFLTPSLEESSVSYESPLEMDNDYASMKPRPHGDAFGLESIEEDFACKGSGFVCRDFQTNDCTLRLTGRHDLEECVHYVAVSYCWKSSEEAMYGGPAFEVVSKGEYRPPKCPSNLLQRVIHFATFYKYEFIWIDQECIDQEDSLDKQTGIQAMDAVYHQAEKSVAVLEACIRTQRQVHALQMLMESDNLDYEYLSDLAEALEIIMADPWFERAWPLQESICASRQMSLLVRYEAGLDIPLGLWLKDNIELELSSLHDILSSWLQTVLASCDTLWEGAVTSCNKAVDKWFTLMIPETDREYDLETRPGASSGSEALAFLSSRRNSVVSDRLAILANLSGYPIGLDLASLEKLDHSFSMCALVLSIVNGDLSFLVRASIIQNDVQSQTRGPKEILSGGHGFSWMPGFETSLDDCASFQGFSNTLMIDVLSLSSNGLAIRGCLWEVDKILDVTPVQNRAFERWDRAFVFEALQAKNVPFNGRPGESYYRLYAPRVIILTELLCFIFAEGFHRVAEQLWSALRRRPTKKELKDSQEVRDYNEASLERVFDIPSRSFRWLSPISGGREDFFERETGIKSTDSPFQVLEGGLSEWLLHIVVEEGRFPIARPVRRIAKAENYAGIFKSTPLNAKIFTPRNQLHAGEYTLQAPRYNYAWYPSNFVVEGSPQYTIDGDNTFLCRGCTQGTWTADEDCLDTIHIM